VENFGALYREQQLIVFGHYWKSGIGKKKTYQASFDSPETSNLNPEIERLWAYAKIQELKTLVEQNGDGDDFKEAIIDISKEYEIITDYTSMLIVREERFEQLGIGYLYS